MWKPNNKMIASIPAVSATILNIHDTSLNLQRFTMLNFKKANVNCVRTTKCLYTQYTYMYISMLKGQRTQYNNNKGTLTFLLTIQ